ncbi:CAP domain-containing protein [Mycobacterium paraterrae]|uniref:CAP domain-containing protein n=1 Tax=Mycobacterium paraterrae TaxID=577492 RepID=A0ABY3VS06_9MYCO|nr:CAP domain-containing protein [Mycobacterium paraterrae]UMB71398.1 CAP domain-containing protein [Mycobacterium paraterrae]
MTDNRIRRAVPLLGATLAVVVPGAVAAAAPGVPGNNDRLNNGIVVNVDTIKAQAGCTTKLKKNPQLEAAAQRHTVDVLNNRSLDADIGSDGSSVADRARDAGYRGVVAETVAINNSLAINDLDVMGNWYYRPDYKAIMSNCANTQIGVWSENSIDRSVLVAVYGQPDR